jgi:hypothetical protein
VLQEGVALVEDGRAVAALHLCSAVGVQITHVHV